MNTATQTLQTSSRREALVASIKMGNNGYLNLEYMSHSERQFARHVAELGIVKITNGLVHMPSTKPEFFQSPYTVKAFKPVYDGPDYEAAILDRQAAQGFND